MCVFTIPSWSCQKALMSYASVAILSLNGKTSSPDSLRRFGSELGTWHVYLEKTTPLLSVCEPYRARCETHRQPEAKREPEVGKTPEPPKFSPEEKPDTLYEMANSDLLVVYKNIC